MESDSSGISMPDTGLPHGLPWPAHCGAVCSFPQRNSLVEINGEQCRGPVPTRLLPGISVA